jgi:nitrate/nitrite-specific signal transduction histidine kinase
MSDTEALERQVELLEDANAKHLQALAHAGEKARELRAELDRAYETLREFSVGVVK